MKTALLFASILSVSAASHAALKLNGTTALTEWNTSPAGQALLKQDEVSAQVKVEAAGDLALKFNGYARIEVCDEYGPSPNGEPEFAPCVKSHMTFQPKFDLELPVKLTTTVEDVSGVQTATLSNSINSCVENYDSLIQLAIPTTPPAKAVVKAKCDVYLASAQVTTTGKSVKLAQSEIQAIATVLLETKLQTTHVITVENGRVSQETAAEIAAAAKKLKSAGIGNSVYVTAKVMNRGQTIDLFNSGLSIDLK